jgi:hypothetical protein
MDSSVGMMSHPPIPIHDLAAHIDDLKANDNMKFSQEYESIEPGMMVISDHCFFKHMSTAFWKTNNFLGLIFRSNFMVSRPCIKGFVLITLSGTLF